MPAIIQTGFIGSGNMANALIKGLIGNGVDPASIGIADPDQAKLNALKEECSVSVFDSNQALIEVANIVVLAVKPQIMEAVVSELADTLNNNNCLLISIAAGITLNNLTTWSHSGQALVRCMPNTPALVQAGASALFANDSCSAEQKNSAQQILEAVGTVVWLDNEEQMDAVTALSGSGPAYFFLLIEAMQDAGKKLGLDDKIVSALSLQTAFGAAALANSSDVDVAELRKRVTSPGGTTEAALNQFENDGFSAMVERALTKAAERSKALAK